MDTLTMIYKKGATCSARICRKQKK